VNSGTEPTPIKDTGLSDTQTRDLMIREAFRQGWESARHWPNHPLPKHLFITVHLGTEDIVLKIEWP
jgi:hypothetical protein